MTLIYIYECVGLLLKNAPLYSVAGYLGGRSWLKLFLQKDLDMFGHLFYWDERNSLEYQHAITDRLDCVIRMMSVPYRGSSWTLCSTWRANMKKPHLKCLSVTAIKKVGHL